MGMAQKTPRSVAVGTVRSADGTPIAFEVTGDGPPLILVDGALCHRASGPARPLARELTGQFTVVAYDRRGRGESGDTAPYAVGREIDDLAALIEAFGGRAAGYGISSGAALALEAAAHGLPISRLALYEAPFVVDDSRAPVAEDYLRRLRGLLGCGQRDDAVRHFLRNAVGLPGALVTMMRFLPAWSKLTRVAHTLPYDHLILGDNVTGRPFPPGRWSSVTVPTLVAAGGKSSDWVRTSMRALAAALPDARYRTIPGQTHQVRPQAIAPVLTEFFRDRAQVQEKSAS
jgi:pimeloyl-ACP methyl ester carboxylesterase